jgi:hypothetical protein
VTHLSSASAPVCTASQPAGAPVRGNVMSHVDKDGRSGGAGTHPRPVTCRALPLSLLLPLLGTIGLAGASVPNVTLVLPLRRSEGTNVVAQHASLLVFARPWYVRVQFSSAPQCEDAALIDSAREAAR